jgi:hypothetical protein
LQTTWQNLSLVSSLNIFANSVWTYLMQQSLPKIGQQECVGQYMLSRTRLPTIIINHKCHNKLWRNDKKTRNSHKGHNYDSRTIIPNHKSFPNENKATKNKIHLINLKIL